MNSANYSKETREGKMKAEKFKAKIPSIPSPIAVKVTKKDLAAVTEEEIGEYSNFDTVDGKRKAAAYRRARGWVS